MPHQVRYTSYGVFKDEEYSKSVFSFIIVHFV
jgi:hypothetical protein